MEEREVGRKEGTDGRREEGKDRWREERGEEKNVNIILFCFS